MSGNKDIVSSAGLGLRIPHLQHVLKERPEVPWFEVHICNFLRSKLNYYLLQSVAELYPVSFHGVSLNLGGVEPVNGDYLRCLKRAVVDLSPVLVSDHACVAGLENQYFHDLLPVPFSQAAVVHFVERIDQVQTTLNRKILIENISRYVVNEHMEMTEGEFLAQVSQQSGCGILCDLNNAYVNQLNLDEPLEEFLDTLPTDRIEEIHLAGHAQIDNHIIDTHSTAVCDAVWDVFATFTAQAPQVPCLIEWDNQLPSFNRLNQERITAQAIMDGHKEDYVHAINRSQSA